MNAPYRPPSIKIDKSDPFNSNVDHFDRKPVADALTRIVRSSTDGLTIALDSPWGTGKTTFLEMWEAQLKSDGFVTLSFNAWECDFVEDALVALIGEFESGLASEASDNPTVSDAIDKAKKTGARLLKRAIPALVKLATPKMLDLDVVIEKALTNFLEKFAEDQIREYETSKKVDGDI